MKKNVQRNRVPVGTVIDRILLNVRRLNIYILVLGPMVISLLLLGILSILGNKLYGLEVPEVYQAISVVIFLVVLSFSGVIQIYRREGLGPLGSPVFGIWPMISGWIITIVCWASIIYLIARIFKLMA